MAGGGPHRARIEVLRHRAELVEDRLVAPQRGVDVRVQAEPARKTAGRRDLGRRRQRRLPPAVQHLLRRTARVQRHEEARAERKVADRAALVRPHAVPGVQQPAEGGADGAQRHALDVARPRDLRGRDRSPRPHARQVPLRLCQRHTVRRQPDACLVHHFLQDLHGNLWLRVPNLHSHRHPLKHIHPHAVYFPRMPGAAGIPHNQRCRCSATPAGWRPR